MSRRLLGISIVVPCLNEDHRVLRDLKMKLVKEGAEVIIVDDGSLNETYPDSIKHGTNFGYGAAIMTGIKNSKNNIIMTLDGDGEHTISDVMRLATAWKIMDADMLIGSRRLKKEIWYRYLGRKFLNWTASFLSMFWFQDLNSGMRIFKRTIVEGYIPILCKSFSFTTSLTLSMFLDGYRIEWFPIYNAPRKYGKSRVRIIKDGFVTLWYIIKISFALRTRKLRKLFRVLTRRENVGA